MKCEPVVLVMPSTAADRLDELRAERWGRVQPVDQDAVRAMCVANGWPLESFVAGTVVASILDEVLHA